MIAQYCIERPVFASVLSIVLVLVGVTALFNMPVDQYPDITPPMVTVSGSYAGATADIAAEAVAVPVEQRINGVPNMLYMTSQSTNSGKVKVNITFEVGTSSDFAAIDVQNKVKLAESELPMDVITDGVTVEKSSSIPLMSIVLRSSVDRFDDLYLSNFVTLNIQNALKRIPGVGRTRNTGARSYSMRIWLNPDALAAYGLTPSDVSAAVQEQNKNAAAGVVGNQPASESVNITLPISATGKLNDAEAFGDVIVHSTDDGGLIRLRDVARVELGSSSYTLVSRHNGESAAVLGVLLLPGSNALAVAENVRETMQRLSKSFPKGIDYEIAYDASDFISSSIKAVSWTLIEALILVAIVVFCFLQNWRTAIIPMLAAPVSIIGTFVFLLAFGFTINTISLLALVLAIGLVVDDAIVVVENVERLMSEKGLDVKAATSQAMKELTGALLATSLVLAAVFLPVAFLGGISGKLYREFAITLTIAVLISTFVAMTLSPALCALLMKPNSAPHKYFVWFNQYLEKLTSKYTDAVTQTLKRTLRSAFIFLAMTGIALFLYNQLPMSFMPKEDQGQLLVDVQLQPGTSVARTDELMVVIEQEILAHPAVAHTLSLSGENKSNGSGEENGNFQIFLKPWPEREDYTVDQVQKDLLIILAKYPPISSLVMQPPAIAGLGSGAGFEFQLQDNTGNNQIALNEAAFKLVEEANKLPELSSVSTSLKADVPLLRLEIDREMIKTFKVSLSDLYTSLKQLTGSSNVSDFSLYGRVYKVKMQADSNFRRRPEDLNRFYIRSGTGALVPLSMLAKLVYDAGPGTLSRHNLFTSVSISGESASGYSSGQAMQAIEKLMNETLPPGISYEWTGLSYQERKASGEAGIAMLLAIVFVYLFLAALYESWITPIAVLLIVPIAIAGATAFVYLRGMENNIFFQISLVALIGLAAKNAILIVEFARTLKESGMSSYDASIEAAKQRFRPILMTSLAFILGILPLVLSSGPGAMARISISTGTLGGMVAATTIGLLLVPWFFYHLTRKSDPVKNDASSSKVEGASS
jgi:hydrophobe/amphiphile efflux-1 (HAE1) family protein